MAEKRIRGRALQTLRAQVLTDNPLCVSCAKLGRATIATEVDHITALVNDGTNGRDNMQGLCAQCHADKTLIDLGRKPATKFDAKGLVIW